MENIQSYLIRNGFVSHHTRFINGKYTLVKGCTASFSTMGELINIWIKDDVKIAYGLNEANKPPTLITHPFIIVEQKNNNGVVETIIKPFSDDIVNRMLTIIEPKIIVDALVKKQKINIQPYINLWN